MRTILNSLHGAALIGLGVFIFLPRLSMAQSGLTASQAARNFTFGSSDLTLPLFVPRSDADADLGIQQILQHDDDYDPFNASLWAGYQFTDNARLVDGDLQSDHLFVSNASLSYLPVISGNLYAEATLRYQTFRYDALSDLDFDSLDAGLGVVNVMRSLGDLSLFLRYNLAQFEDPSSGTSDLFSNHSIQTGACKGWTLSRDHFLYVSWISDFSVSANPGFADRDEHGITLVYRITPVDKVKVEFFHRSSILDFANGGREDLNYATGASASYNFTPNLHVTTHVSNVSNNSNEAGTGDYEVWQTGIQFGGFWKF